MERQLGLEEQKSDVDATTERGLPKSKTYDYKVRTREQVREARKHEKELPDDYEQWLKKHGCHLSMLPYGRLEYDA